MKVLMLISDGMEECEALVPRDILIRSQIEVLMYATNGKNEIKSSHNLLVKADINELHLDEYEAVILPGGGLGTKNLQTFKDIDHILNYFSNANKLMCAICAAPSVLGKRGYLDGKKFTCFSGFEQGINGNYQDKGVVVDGRIITARSMYYSADFGLEIVGFLLGEDKKNDIRNKIMSK